MLSALSLLLLSLGVYQSVTAMRIRSALSCC